MGCHRAHGDDLPGLSPEFLQLQLFFFHYRFHLVLVSTLQMTWVSFTIQSRLGRIDTMAPCLIRVMIFAASPFVKFWMRRSRAASCAASL